MKKAKSIKYDLIYPNGDHCQHEIILEPETMEHKAPPAPAPEWCDLEFHKCDICPLSKTETPTCPLAMRIAPLFQFPIHESFEKVEVKVTKDNVTINAETSVQDAYRSLVGLIIATSGCPHTRFFKPMAWFHLPFATQDETIFRACATFLLFQFFNPDDADKENHISDLRTIYENIHEVNLGIAKRLESASANSSALNAIVILDIFAKSILPVLNESLSELAFLFTPKTNL